MFFAKPGVYEPCGIYNIRHLIIAIGTLICVVIAAVMTKTNKKEDIKKIIRNVTITIWCLEIIKIIYLVAIGQGRINRVVPLYYCSLLLYSGLMSSFGKGVIKKMGDVFLATGGIVGGLVFIACPTTSLPEYPAFHFISIHSFLFYGTMLYLGLIVNRNKYVELKFEDIKYYASLIFVICMFAYVVNNVSGSNLMFISQDFPGMPITILYNGVGVLFTPIMIILQMTVPFLIIYALLKGGEHIWKKEK
ncbi:MAG: YwaF family protein [Clostridia bacterium]|nr:YwaF family protein [Clostridia bacterium]